MEKINGWHLSLFSGLNERRKKQLIPETDLYEFNQQNHNNPYSLHHYRQVWASQLANLKNSIPLILLSWNLYGRSGWYTKITIFVNMSNFGQFLEKSIFSQ